MGISMIALICAFLLKEDLVRSKKEQLSNSIISENAIKSK